jgi:hypothetical protein
MKRIFAFLTFFSAIYGYSQETRDTTLSRCPVFITDTVSVNNFFIEGRPCILKVYKVKGMLTVQVEQKDQFFTLFFHAGHLRNGKYAIKKGSNGRKEVEVAYSFKSGDQASFISVTNGTVEASYDKEKKFWLLRVNGMIPNMVERTVTYYRAKADLYIR